MSSSLSPKPFLKWVGGKTQIIQKVISKFPKQINNYHEIFLGGGSVLFALLNNINTGSITVSGKVYAYDYNNVLIHVYKNMQSDVGRLWERLQVHIDTYNASQNVEEHYYICRQTYNSMTEEEKCGYDGSAFFILLNKTCFRGLYREGPNGFNVPFGHYKNPTIATFEHLSSVSELIQNVEFFQADFEASIGKVELADFVYLDPPYAPEKKTSFVGYNRAIFDENTHIQLFNMCKVYKFSFLMSNSHVDLVINSFNDTRSFHTDIIEAKRTINCKNPQAKTKEVLISFNFII
jgi:DNA adenine methylase